MRNKKQAPIPAAERRRVGTGTRPPRGTGGAWEVGARYSFVDLTAGPVRGGKLDDVTLGLTWYLNPLFRVDFNYEYLYRHDVSNEATAGLQHAFGTRIALDF